MVFNRAIRNKIMNSSNELSVLFYNGVFYPLSVLGFNYFVPITDIVWTKIVISSSFINALVQRDINNLISKELQ